MKYYVKSVSCKAVVDSYRNGQDPYTEQYWDESSNFSGETIEEVVDAVLAYYNMEKEDATVLDDRIIVSRISDEHLSPMSEKDLARWRNSEITGFSFEIDFRVYGLIGHDELVATTNIESYD